MNIPDKIYLLIKDEDGEEPDEVMWCEDRVHDTDIEYVRPNLIVTFRDYWCEKCGVESVFWQCKICGSWCSPILNRTFLSAKKGVQRC